MNALMVLITVLILLPHAPTLWGASPVPVTLDTVGMAPTVQVRKILIKPLKILRHPPLLQQTLMNVQLVLITVLIFSPHAPTLWEASPVPATLDTVEMAPAAHVSELLRVVVYSHAVPSLVQ